MAKPEWGKKRSCPSCGTRFYDLRKDPIVCPSCGEQVDPDSGGKVKRSRASAKDDGARKKTAAAAAGPAESQVEETEVDEAEVEDGDDYEDDESVDDTEEIDEDLPGVGDDDEEES